MPLLRNKTFQRLMAGSFLERWGVRILAESELFMLGFHKDRDVMRRLARVRRGRRSLITGNEQFIIHAIVAGMRRLEGDIAEVGVYAGSSTRTICEATLIGMISAQKPRMSPMLQMLEPTTLPTLMSPCPK